MDINDVVRNEVSKRNFSSLSTGLKQVRKENTETLERVLSLEQTIVQLQQQIQILQTQNSIAMAGGFGETLLLVDGLGITLDNSLYSINIDTQDLVIGIGSDGITTELNNKGIRIKTAADSYDIGLLADNMSVEVKCGSTLVPENELMQKVAGENIAGFRAVTVDNEGRIIHATIARILTGLPVIAISVQAVEAFSLCIVTVTGDEITENSWDWDMSESIYFTEDGILTQVPPTTNFLQIVAVPLSPTSLRVRIEPPIFF